MSLHRLGTAAATSMVGAAIVAAGIIGALAQPAPAPPPPPGPGPHGPSHPLAPLGPRGTPDPRPRPLPNVVDDLDQPSLGAAALERAIAPYIYDVRLCWEKQVRSGGGAGHLRLELVIEHDGRVSRAVVVAPRVTRAERGRLQACVARAARRWHFPLRRGATYAVFPFFFDRAGAPGPRREPGCDSPRGCPPGQEVRP